MFKEKTKELKMSNEFRKKIIMICKFACVKYELAFLYTKNKEIMVENQP